MAASGKQPFEVRDFTGGITDDSFSGETNTNFELDNFLITSEGKPLSRPGSVLDDAAHSPIPLGNSRIGALINYNRNEKLFAQSAKKLYYRANADETGSWNLLTGPGGNDVFSSGTTSNFISHAEWNKQIFLTSDAFPIVQRVFRDGAGNYQVRNAGLPALAAAPTVGPGSIGSQGFVYAFHYRYQFSADTQTFADLGPATWVTVSSSGDPASSPNVVSGIPALTNAGGNNFDLANVMVEIYRTINNGTNFYKIGEVANGTTTFTDNFADANIQQNLQLYTNDGTLDYYPPPPAKFVHVVNNIGYYANTSDSFGFHPYRVHTSIPGNPGLVPLATYVEVADEVTGIGSVKGLPILFSKKLVHRLDGQFSAQGAGNVVPQRIHATAGCISGASIVEAENYCFWAGNDGFYATDGYQVIKVTDHLNSRYKAMVAAMNGKTGRIQARYDEINRLVYWSVARDASNLENDALWILDLKRPISTKSTFTTWSGKSFRPSAIEVFNAVLYRGDQNGFVFRHDEEILTDPRVTILTPATAWTTETIIWNLVSNQFNFGGSFMRKMVSRILLQAANNGNTTIQITAINDQGKRIRQLKQIRWRRNFMWGDPGFVWGNTDCIWNAEGIIEQWRRMPAGGLRLSYLQVQITNGLGIISNSDSDGTCSLNRSTKMVILPGLWPSDCVDYFLTFENDGYVRKFPIVSLNSSGDTVIVLDPENRLPPSGTYRWELQGYRKGEPLNLLGYNLHWDAVDQNQGTFQTGDQGGNS